MPISERVTRLRQQSLDAIPSISSERAEILTHFYQNLTGLHSIPVQRALAFSYLLENRSIVINPGELIVGEKGPASKAAPTYPELCCHSLQDLEILNDRQKIPFSVSDQVRKVYAEKIIPFWKGRSMRDLIFEEMKPEWKDAYQAGIFTEFMEQRSPGHTVLDDKIYRQGFLALIEKIDNLLARMDTSHDPLAYAKEQELMAMRICALAIIIFAERHAELAQQMAEHENRPAAPGRA